jgi:signal transduction histidine kinase/CheY-like chemotaxis protein
MTQLSQQFDVDPESGLLLYTEKRSREMISEEKIDLQNTEKALLNILDDYSEEKYHSEDSQRALLNILDDYSEEKINMESTQRAVLNILEDYSEAKEKAEESTKLKEAFLANMSHEIRTPMNAIIGFSDILSKGDLAEKEMEYVRTIKTAGENLLTIINDILDISKIEAGMMTFEEHTFCVKDIFKSLSVMLMGRAQEKQLELVFTCDALVPDTLLGDPTRLTQIIINLAGNAIKFTQKGRIRVAVEVLRYEQDITWLEFTVRDTGIGISPDKLDHIFERFRQAESHITRKYGGTGLGLSIAKQLVELQGGKLTVESIFKEGSVFSFSMPYRKSVEVLPTSETSGSKYNMEALSRLNILLVEDNHLNVKLIHSLFSEYSLKLEVAENGSVGIEKLKQGNFDIVLMDMEMPVMNGYEAATVIRHELKSKIPIIAMTAHAMSGEKERCLSLGMNDYISKPINANLLFEKIYELTL